jgi:hypothetical protein
VVRNRFGEAGVVDFWFRSPAFWFYSPRSAELVQSKGKRMAPFKRSLAAAILTAGCCLSVSAVDAQTQSVPAGPSVSAPDLSDRKLDAAAAAIERVVTVQQDYQQRFAATEESAEKERIVAEANNEVEKAITDQGISIEEYISILDAARGDPEVRGKILQRIRPPEK